LPEDGRVSKPSIVIVVVEDDHHEMLVRRYLKKRGLVEREMRIRRSPSGEGSAENWVRKTFADEVSRYRNRHAQTALIVVIDADTATVQHRLTQLDQALRDNGKETVDPGRERIARLVPKRNIETWILCLNGHLVDEETDCKTRSRDWNELIPPAAETLFQWARSKAELPNHCTDSLRNGINELKRLTL
jgi:hypothetical protein